MLNFLINMLIFSVNKFHCLCFDGRNVRPGLVLLAGLGWPDSALGGRAKDKSFPMTVFRVLSLSLDLFSSFNLRSKSFIFCWKVEDILITWYNLHQLCAWLSSRRLESIYSASHAKHYKPTVDDVSLFLE